MCVYIYIFLLLAFSFDSSVSLSISVVKFFIWASSSFLLDLTEGVIVAAVTRIHIAERFKAKIVTMHHRIKSIQISKTQHKSKKAGNEVV